MELEDSGEELYITQSSPQRERRLVVGDDCYLETLSTIEPNRDVWDINIHEKQPVVVNRFAMPVSDIETQAKIGDCVAKSTKYKDKWALNMFENWRQQRNKKVYNVGAGSDCLAGLQIIQNCLEVMSDEELNRTLALFVCEVRKIDGSRYPPNTLHGIVASIQHYLKGKGRAVRLFNDDKFAYLRDALDAMMKESPSSGLGLTTKQGEVITLDEEEELWGKGVLGDSNAQQLLDTMVYLFGKRRK